MNLSQKITESLKPVAEASSPWIKNKDSMLTAYLDLDSGKLSNKPESGLVQLFLGVDQSFIDANPTIGKDLAKLINKFYDEGEDDETVVKYKKQKVYWEEIQ